MSMAARICLLHCALQAGSLLVNRASLEELFEACAKTRYIYISPLRQQHPSQIFNKRVSFYRTCPVAVCVIPPLQAPTRAMSEVSQSLLEAQKWAREALTFLHENSEEKDSLLWSRVPIGCSSMFTGLGYGERAMEYIDAARKCEDPGYKTLHEPCFGVDRFSSGVLGLTGDI